MKRPFVTTSSRRRFLALATTSLGALAIPLRGAAGIRIRFGLVTYMWGADWDLETLIRNCGTARVSGVELGSITRTRLILPSAVLRGRRSKPGLPTLR
ncbi:MAG: hypothetical protein R3F31_18370 [Verrucomicrobiales bacterium]